MITSNQPLDPIEQPVLNTPYEEPSRHWRLSEDNRAMAEVQQGRRESIGMLPVPKSQSSQTALELDDTKLNKTVNDIRDAVSGWRRNGYRRATKASRDLLHYWRSDENVPRLFFAQVEALETLIWLTEVVRSDHQLREAVESSSAEHNDGIIRYAIKMATGTGKTVVMGMVIAWHAVNAALHKRSDDRYLTKWVAIAPGITVRDRLQVLVPSSSDNIYDEMGLVPRGKRRCFDRVRVHVVNFQAFQRRDRLLEATGDARKLLRGAQRRDLESPTAMIDRVLRGLYYRQPGLQRERERERERTISAS